MSDKNSYIDCDIDPFGRAKGTVENYLSQKNLCKRNEGLGDIAFLEKMDRDFWIRLEEVVGPEFNRVANILGEEPPRLALRIAEVSKDIEINEDKTALRPKNPSTFLIFDESLGRPRPKTTDEKLQDLGLLKLDVCDEILAEDGGVVKRVLREGKAEQGKPKSLSKVKLTWTSRFLSDGKLTPDQVLTQKIHVVDNPRAPDMVPGVNLAVKTMHVGELARVTVKPPHGYSYGKTPQTATQEETSSASASDGPMFNHPVNGALPIPNRNVQAETIVFEIELHSYELSTVSDPTALTPAQRFEEAKSLKERGNLAFGKGEMKEALSNYNKMKTGLQACKKFCQDDTELRTNWNGLMITALNNLSAVYLKTGSAKQADGKIEDAKKDYKLSLTCCSDALSIEPLNAKSLFRRSKTKKLSGDHAGALADLEQIQGKDSTTTKEVQIELKELRSLLGIAQTREKKVYEGMFGKLSEEGGLYKDEITTLGNSESELLSHLMPKAKGGSSSSKQPSAESATPVSDRSATTKEEVPAAVSRPAAVVTPEDENWAPPKSANKDKEAPKSHILEQQTANEQQQQYWNEENFQDQDFEDEQDFCENEEDYDWDHEDPNFHVFYTSSGVVRIPKK